MKTRKEQRKAEKLRKQKVAKNGGGGFRFKAPTPGLEDDFHGFPSDIMAKFAVPEYTDELAEHVGMDADGDYVGECGEVTEHWQQHHVDCSHGFTTGTWWVLVKDAKVVSVPDKNAAMQALFKAGAVKVRGTDIEVGGLGDMADDLPAGTVVGGYRLRDPAPKGRPHGWLSSEIDGLENDDDMWVTGEGQRADGSYDFMVMNFRHREDLEAYMAMSGAGADFDMETTATDAEGLARWNKHKPLEP